MEASNTVISDMKRLIIEKDDKNGFSAILEELPADYKDEVCTLRFAIIDYLLVLVSAEKVQARGDFVKSVDAVHNVYMSLMEPAMRKML